MNKMFTRTIIIPIIFLIMYGNVQYVYAQRAAKISMIDGTSIEGVISECTDTDSLTILVNGNSSNSVTVSMGQITQLDFGLSPQKNSNEVNEIMLQESQEENATIEDVVYHSIALGLLFGEDETNYFISVESGFRVNNHFAVGLGLNYDNYDIISTVPFFVEVKGYLHDKKVAPYYFVGAGYGVSWLNESMDDFLISNEKIRGGLFGHTGLGYQVKGKGLSYAFKIGYKLQKTRISYQYNTEPWRSSSPMLSDVQEKRMFRRLFFSVSVIF